MYHNSPLVDHVVHATGYMGSVRCNPRFMIKSSFKSRAGYDGAATLLKIFANSYNVFHNLGISQLTTMDHVVHATGYMGSVQCNLKAILCLQCSANLLISSCN